jgi:N,N'-diacetyllegionaminate synthase
MNLDKVLIIAEAGVNHNGSLELAKKMIEVAKDSGADIVKFQTFKAENLVTKLAKKASYQIKNIDLDDSQFTMLKNLEITYDNHIELINYSNLVGIQFLSTGFDLESLTFLNSLNPPFFKIPSGEITNYPYLRLISTFKRPIILSTGMSTLQDISNAIKVLIEGGIKLDDIIVLHCNTDYPTPFSDVNLLAMKTICETFSVSIGYSDHTSGIEVSLAAVALGAKVIEKHFTLDKYMDGPDHKASLNPSELKMMVMGIRNIEIAMGSNKKHPTPSETKNINVVRKSIIASKRINKGDIFSEENLTTKRPGTGLSPMIWNNIIGKQAIRDFEIDDLIEI